MPNKPSVTQLAENSARDESALAKVTSCLTKKKELFPILVHTGSLGSAMPAIHQSSITLNTPYGLLSVHGAQTNSANSHCFLGLFGTLSLCCFPGFWKDLAAQRNISQVCGLAISAE